MLKLLKYYIVPILFLSSCTDKTEISFVCDKDSKNNYIIKWEVFPYKKEQARIEIFASTDDKIFAKTPIYTTQVNNYIAILPNDKDVFREFFKLKIGNCYSSIISNRFFDNENIQNLRDIGGYTTNSDKQVKWGKLYRSGQISNPSKGDKVLLESLHIKTVIDLRADLQKQKSPDILNKKINYIQIPIDIDYFNNDIKSLIIEGGLPKNEAILHTQNCYKDLVFKHTKEYAEFLDALCDEDNYPILFHCGWGKDRTGLASYFILRALGVESQYLEEDYLYSREGIDKKQILEDADKMPENVQEIISMMAIADISHLRYALSCIREKSGSVEEYMTKELKLTPDKIEKLRSILLY